MKTHTKYRYSSRPWSELESNKYRGEMIVRRVALDRLYAALHERSRLLLRAGRQVLQQLQ